MSGIDVGELGTLVQAWLPDQRWFAGKGRQVTSVDLAPPVLLRTESPVLLHQLATVHFAADGGDPVPPQHYQLLIGLRADPDERLDHATLGVLEDGRQVYDGLADAALGAELLARLAAGADVAGLHFTVTDELDASLHSRSLGVEQSNTSVVFGSKYILKVFRRLSPGENPDLEVSRALADVGCEHTLPALGWIEGSVSGEVTTLAMLQPFLTTATEGWALATTSVRDLYAEADLHADEVGGDFAGEAERLGAATATVHQDLARALPSETVGAAECAATSKQLLERLAVAVREVPALAPFSEAVRAVYAGVATLTEGVAVQRVHGDLHLGQVLRTQTRWVLLDFEGEPSRPLSERRALMSPLRDVAGMLRSFDYAARHLLADHPGEQHLTYRATEWATRNRGAFCDGYATAMGTDPRDSTVLLTAFELDKAVYEVVYEARHRPTWISIPLGAIERLVG